MSRPHRPNPAQGIQPGESQAQYRARRKVTHVKQETSTERKARLRHDAMTRQAAHDMIRAKYHTPAVAR